MRLALSTSSMTAGRAIAPAAGQLGRQLQVAVSASAVRDFCCPLSLSQAPPFPQCRAACVVLLVLIVSLFISDMQEQPEDGNRRDLMRRLVCCRTVSSLTPCSSGPVPCPCSTV